MVDLKRLSHLVALAEERHFARAAQRVHLSQPAFSRSIQLLESQVGMKLFDRETGQVKPTPAGLFLVDRARRLLFDARSLHRDTQLYRDSRLGDTAFGAGPLPAATLMPVVLRELRLQYPQVGLRVEMNNWQLLHDRLCAEDIEFFVSDVRDLQPDAKLVVLPAGRQLTQVLARAGHALAGRDCTLQDLLAFGVASTRWPASTRAEVTRLVGGENGEMRLLALECDDVALLRHLALTTDTVIAVSEASCRADLDAGTLVRLQVQGLPQLSTDMGIVLLARRTPSPMAERAIGCVQEVARQMNLH
jgi:DNA-binding transcriptional LysR family regulator